MFEFQDTLSNFLFQYPILAPLIFIFLRSSSVIFPPIPGLAFDLVGIVVFGPIVGLIYAEAGIMFGASVAFFIARRFREPAVGKFAALNKVNNWVDRLSDYKQFWVLVAVRLPAHTFFDYISYAAGLTKISFTKYFFSSLLANVPIMFLIYYFGGLSIQSGLFYFTLFAVSLVILLLLFSKQLVYRQK